MHVHWGRVRAAALAHVAAVLVFTTGVAAADVAVAPAARGAVPVTVSAPPPARIPPPGQIAPAGSDDVSVDRQAPSLPAGITAQSWLLADADTGHILAARHPHVRDLPASTMKILTALTVLPRLSPSEPVLIGDEAARVDGTKVGLVPGQRYTVRDLATSMLIGSGNDATVALVTRAGGTNVVLDQMNRLAAALGAHDTVARDPAGLDAPGQETSAHDLAVLGRAALDSPAVSGYLTIPRATLPGRDGVTFQIQNHNTLLGTYEGTIGVKNGYTDAARATFVGAARRNGRTLLVALMRTDPAYSHDARALLDWGFANAASARPVGRLGEPEAPPTKGDEAAEALDERQVGDGGLRVGTILGYVTGPATWAAVAVTVTAAGFTVLARRRRRRGGRPERRWGRPTQRGRRLALPPLAKFSSGYDSTQDGDTKRPPATMPMARPAGPPDDVPSPAEPSPSTSPSVRLVPSRSVTVPPTPAPVPTPSVSPSVTVVPSPAPSAFATGSPSVTVLPAPSVTPSATVVPSPAPSVFAMGSPSATVLPAPSPSPSPSHSSSAAPPPSPPPAPSPSAVPDGTTSPQ